MNTPSLKQRIDALECAIVDVCNSKDYDTEVLIDTLDTLFYMRREYVALESTNPDEQKF